MEPPNNEPKKEGLSSYQDDTTVFDPLEDQGRADHDPLVGSTVGQYTLKRIIGSGGMGTVYEAVQKSPRRAVAIKMMRSGITSRNAMRRFEYEAQTLGRLRHESIAQIFEAGTLNEGAEARPFFAMEYIIGARPLTVYARENELGIRERLQLFIKVCDAVQHGHQKGVIHRDLKPQNILVTSSGAPKVIDFGVARSTEPDMAMTSLLTNVGVLVGTLQYMSPEQFAANPNDIDTRSDVYSLGVVLYELLCDDLPYDLRSAAIHEAARIVREDDPIRPSTINRRLRGDLETITLKALDKDRRRRYQSAEALEEDIRHYLDGEPIAAKAPNTFEYLRRFVRRYTAAAITIASIFVVLILAVIAISIFAVTAVQAREVAQQKEFEANAAKEEAEQAEKKAARRAYEGNIYSASVAQQHGNVGAVHSRLELARSVMGDPPPPPEQMPFEWRHLEVSRNQALETFNIGKGEFIDLDWSPDGTYMLAGSREGDIYVLEGSGEERWIGRHEGGLRNVDICPMLDESAIDVAPESWGAPNEDGDSAQSFGFGTGRDKEGLRHTPRYQQRHLAASGGEDGFVQLWRLSDGERIKTIFAHDGAVTDIDFTPDGKQFWTTGADGVICLWSTETGQKEREFVGHEGLVNDITLSDDGSRMASAGADSSILIWDTGSGEVVGIINGHVDQVRAINFLSGGETLISAGFDMTIRLWRDFDHGIDVEPTSVAVLRGHEHWINDIDIDERGQWLVSASRDQTVRVWSLSDLGLTPKVLRGHERDVQTVEFNSETGELATGSRDGTVRTWLLRDRSTAVELSGHEYMTWSVAFTPDGTGLISGSFDKTVKVWDLELGECMATLTGHTDRVYHVDVSPDREQFASVSSDGTARIWDITTGELRHVLDGTDGTVYMVHFHPRGAVLATSGSDDKIRVWDAATGELVHVLEDDEAPTDIDQDHIQGELMSIVPGQAIGVRGLAYSPDGTRIASGHGDSLVRIWDADTGEVLHRCSGHDDGVRAVAWTPDGETVVSGSFDGTIRTWNARRGDPTGTLHGHTAVVRSVTVNPKGDRIASGSFDETVRIWDLENGTELCALRGGDRYRAVPFSSDEGLLAAGSDSGRIYLFAADRDWVDPDALTSAQERRKRLEELVDDWVLRAGGDKELVAGMYEHKLDTIAPEDRGMLQRLVMRALQAYRSE